MEHARKLEISDSQFNVWRAIIFCIHADNHVDGKEKNWLSQCLNRLSLSAEQANQLRLEFDNPEQLSEILPRITEAKDFAHLLHLAKIIFQIDGRTTPDEKQVYAEIQKYHAEKFGGHIRLATTIAKEFPKEDKYNLLHEAAEEWLDMRHNFSFTRYLAGFQYYYTLRFYRFLRYPLTFVFMCFGLTREKSEKLTTYTVLILLGCFIFSVLKSRVH